MKRAFPTLIILLFCLVIHGCKKDAPEILAPKITNDKVEVTATTATFKWTVDWPGKLISVVEVSENEDMSHSQCYGSDTETDNHNFTVTVTDLKDGTKYFFRYLVWNKFYVDNKYVMEVKSFTTVSLAMPTVTSTEATDISWTTATAGGKVTNDGNDVVSERGVCWGTSHNPDISSSFSHLTASSTGTGEYTCSITGLSPNTQYYLRAYATNSKGTSYGDEKEFTTQAMQKPTVTSASVSQLNFANATAVGGGEVTSDGGDAVTERGIYFGTNPTPATTGTKIAASSAGTGIFTCTMTGLVSGTYYVCAYATNGQGTSYGSEKSFSYNPPPTGSINGLFSVSPTRQIWFSQGNLQYQASSNTWRFAENQWDYVGTQTPDSYGNVGGTINGSDNANISESYEGWIDLFGWGTSSWNSGAVCYQPWSTSTSYIDYYPGGSYINNLTGSYANADWGVYNAIYNGGNAAGQWRTLTKDEWVHVFKGRSNASSKYGHGKVNGVCGLILLPDNWTLPSGLSFTAGNSSWANSYTVEQWTQMEANGAVFLPATGYRNGTSVKCVGSTGEYCSASYYASHSKHSVYFTEGILSPGSSWSERYIGASVRLVCPAE